MSAAPLRSPKDPLDLERLVAEARLASTPVGSQTLSEDRGKGKKKKNLTAYAEAAALSGVPMHELLDTNAGISEYSDIDLDLGTDTEIDSEDEADPGRKRVALDPKRIVISEIDQQGAFTLPLEQAEYIRQQLSFEQPDDIVQRILLEKSPVPENVQQPPRLDDYFRDLLAEQGMGHSRGIDTTLMRMQDNVRNILGPLRGRA